MTTHHQEPPPSPPLSIPQNVTRVIKNPPSEFQTSRPDCCQSETFDSVTDIRTCHYITVSNNPQSPPSILYPPSRPPKKSLHRLRESLTRMPQTRPRLMDGTEYSSRRCDDVKGRRTLTASPASLTTLRASFKETSPVIIDRQETRTDSRIFAAWNPLASPMPLVTRA